MKVTVIAMNEGHDGARRAGRYFPNGAEVVLEVVPTKDGEDPPGTDRSKVGKKTLEALKADPRLKLLAEGYRSPEDKGALEDATRLLERSDRQLEQAAAEIRRLVSENEDLHSRIAELESRHAPGGGGQHEPSKPAAPPAAPKPPAELTEETAGSVEKKSRK
jgi:hypothetical protein